eukprot:TRINITY_DN8146_c0_g1_i1.p1 TRINITY_DN8146_c0_g1~~TRINITY_DN8146_c0_g1_i1.p1  ORF type:complete len:989 (+),score=182.70 TRINITY_DN8146_c0_g1_i1:27-2969(+)
MAAALLRCRLIPAWPIQRLMYGVKNVRGCSQAASKKFTATMNLPQTQFPIRANATEREPALHALVTDELYAWQQSRKGEPMFVLHDGPPYANGKLHIGHFINKVLKDISVRYQLLRGKHVNFIPGWDCHGLPIELKALEGLGQKSRADLSPMDIRRRARAVAETAIADQAASFQRWGVMADWKNPYLTMDKEYEAAQIGVFLEMVQKQLIYRRLRPVYWSPSTRTALAEAELEYSEAHVSKSVFVTFPLTTIPQALQAATDGESIHAVIWTTTPWTIPANQAISYNPDLDYCVVTSPQTPVSGRHLLVAAARLEHMEQRLKTTLQIVASVKGTALHGAVCQHPFNLRSSPMLAGSHVTSDAGTGLVHTAPGHGHDDFEVCQRNGIAALCPVDDDGRFTADVGVEGLAGLQVLEEGTKACIELLRTNGTLLGSEEKHLHRYPYDWRAKKPIIIRTTEQWFASVTGIRDSILKATESVQMIPAAGLSRLRAMIVDRDDWCISRQRSWGLPIPVFYNADNNSEVLLTEESVQHVRSLVAQHGSDCWWTLPLNELLPPSNRNDGKTWVRGTDTMDVWFDSGSSWNSVLSARGLPVPADLYLEGSDQHRGWFQSSLITSVAVTGHAPYKAVLTHGFALDESGRKQSKSLGNVVDPTLVISGGKNPKTEPAHGADVLRLWVASAETTNDVNIGQNIINTSAETFRKLRNTARFMLGNLNGFELTRKVPLHDLHSVDRFMLHRLYHYCQQVTGAYDSYSYNKVFSAAVNLATSTLSNLYFEIVKDRLYTEASTGLPRSAAQTVLHEVLLRFSKSLAPILPHTAEDIYQHSPIKQAMSVFREGWIDCPAEWNQPDVAKDWKVLLDVRSEVYKVIEQPRAAKKLGSSLEAQVTLQVPRESSVHSLLERLIQAGQLADLMITSDVQLVSTTRTSAEYSGATAMVPDHDGTAVPLVVGVNVTKWGKCARCWRHAETIHDNVCGRCAGVLKQ